MPPTTQQLNVPQQGGGFWSGVGASPNPVTPIQPSATASAIPTSTIGTQPLNITAPPPTQPPSIANLPGAGTPAAGTAPITPTTPAAGQTNTFTDKLSGLVAKFTGKAQEQKIAEDTATNPINSQITQLGTQLQTLQANSLANQEAAANRVGGTTSTNAIATQQELRTASIQGLLLQARIDSLKGDVATAKANADLAIETKYAGIQQDIQTARDNIYNNWDSFSASEKKRASAALEQLDANDQYAKQNIEDEKSIQAMAAAALSNNPGNPAVQLAIDAATKSGDVVQAIKLLSPYQNDQVKASLDKKIQEAQLQKLKNDAAAAVAADAAVNPEVLQGMLNVYKATGVLPAFGMSAKSPLRAQFYAALGSPEGAQIVSDANTAKAVRAGLTTALRTQQNQYSANQTSISTLHKQLDLAKTYSDKVNRAGSPLVNKYIIATKQGVFGDPDTAALNNIVTTASYELAKILSSSSASIAGVTVSSAADAKNLLNSAMSKGQFNQVLGLMRQEADFRLKSQADTLTQLQSDLNNVGNLSSSLSTVSTPNSSQAPKDGDTKLYNGVTYKVIKGVWTPTK